MKKYCAQKYGVYMGFIYPHTEDGKTHYHVGLIWRDKPNHLAWCKVTDYFASVTPGCKVTSRPLKCKARDMKKSFVSTGSTLRTRTSIRIRN